MPRAPRRIATDEGMDRMADRRDPDLTRRRLLKAMAAAPFVLSAPALLGLSDSGAAASSAGLLPPTPACPDDDDDPTPAQTEGPFFTPRSPRRASLIEPGVTGTALVVSGRVFSRTCAPVPNALLDFWQADDAGRYDNAGYRLRGHQFTDARGAFRLETVVPGLYPGRTRHIHVKVQAPGGSILTTQLYFPGESRNARDGIFTPELLMAVSDAGQGHAATFDFVL